MCGTLALQAQTATLKPQGNALQLQVDGQPFFLLGGELGNSSASAIEDIRSIFPRLQQMNLNAVLVPAYWDQIEPTEGHFDFTLTDQILEEARKHQLKVVFLWFGAWKNSMSCYTPAWFKQDIRRFPRAHTRTGKPLEIASVFSKEVLLADQRAFSQWMKHLASTDKEHHTVVMIQIENEIGFLEEARDYSDVAEKQFRAPVPTALVDYLTKHKQQLHPQLKAQWEAHQCRTSGSWNDLFGESLYTDELFMAWHYASYVEQLAQTARQIYPVPLYVNAAMNSRGRKPGEYPSAGPLDHLCDLWHCAAPTLDLYAPDLYDAGFTDWVARYHTAQNPLFVPECQSTVNNAVRAFYLWGEHDALGFSPFSIEDAQGEVAQQLTAGYGKLKEIAPLLHAQVGKGTMHGLLFDRTQSERVLTYGDLRLKCRHYFTLPWDPRAKMEGAWPEGGAVVVQLSKEEFLLSGSGVVVEFALQGEESASAQQALGEDGFLLQGSGDTSVASGSKRKTMERVGLASVEEVQVLPDGTMQTVRRLNGDQTHQGRHVRISVGEYRTLRIRLYRYR